MFLFTEKDVNRTDRNHPFFEGEHNPNVVLLHDILMTYVMYNFDLGYVQGMSDLLAPILYVTQNESMAFWCFVGYMDMVVSILEVLGEIFCHTNLYLFIINCISFISTCI